MNVLFASSEAYPLVKTGGLGDVAYSLPRALRAHGQDIRAVLPAYRDVLEPLKSTDLLGSLTVQGADRRLGVRILNVKENVLGVPLILVDIPELFDRPGNPYMHPDGYAWPDSCERFAVFSRVVAMLARDPFSLGWRADVVHCHDWQTGLVPAFLRHFQQGFEQGDEKTAIKTVFTIHNLAYGGHFSYADFERLQLPGEWWSVDGVEFYGQMSMLKAGIVFSDQLTTVSPTYALEVQTAEFGYGYDGLLGHVRGKFRGILNGVDPDVWNPETDDFIASRYSSTHNLLRGKRENKAALLQECMPDTAIDEALLERPLVGLVSRLVEQKGVDLILGALPIWLHSSDALFVFLGSGQAEYETELQRFAEHYPSRLLLHLGYSEPLAHRIEAGADIFLMPSRFEPCGLNQLYSLKYGTLPVVHATGGLADTVVDASEMNVESGRATGYVFDSPVVDELRATLERALSDYRDKPRWQRLVATAMQQDFGWERSAQAYIQLYRDALRDE